MKIKMIEGSVTNHGTSEQWFFLVDADNEKVHIGQVKKKEHAEEIVTAVNYHKELLERVKESNEVLKRLNEIKDDTTG